jgi:GxxExxY protein
MGELLYKEESFKIIGCCFEVYNTLGVGLLEIVYKNALEYEFKKNNDNSRQKNIGK